MKLDQRVSWLFHAPSLQFCCNCPPSLPPYSTHSLERKGSTRSSASWVPVLMGSATWTSSEYSSHRLVRGGGRGGGGGGGGGGKRRRRGGGGGGGRGGWGVVVVFVVAYFAVLFSSGNAMGYIRMIRSGGLHCCSNAIR